MLTKNVLRLQRYVLDLESKALGKGFSLNLPEERRFSYFNNRMVIDDNEKYDDEKKK